MQTSPVTLSVMFTRGEPIKHNKWQDRQNLSGKRKVRSAISGQSLHREESGKAAILSPNGSILSPS